VRQVLGSIELDPASCELANATIQATRYYDQHRNGLTQEWRARTVWLNPPYCKTGSISNQETWTCKLIAEYEAGHIEQAILLVNAATETRWFQRLYIHPICFMRGRIQFNSPTNTQTGSTVGSALVYFGTNSERFAAVFRQFGAIVGCITAPAASAPLWEGIIQ
jgi:ParB family chromosome partitioning protein